MKRETSMSTLMMKVKPVTHAYTGRDVKHVRNSGLYAVLPSPVLLILSCSTFHLYKLILLVNSANKPDYSPKAV